MHLKLLLAGCVSFYVLLTSCLFSAERPVFAGAISHPQLFIHTGIEDPLRYQYHSLLRGEMNGACAPPNNNSVLLHVKTDITGDGRDDFLVSHQDCLNGKAGNVWNVYVSAPDGFIRVPDVITVHRNTFYVVTIADSGERVIITNRRAARDTSEVVSARLHDGKFRERTLAVVQWSREDDDAYAILKALTSDDTEHTPIETPFSELRARYPEPEETTIRAVEQVFPGYYEAEEGGSGHESSTAEEAG